MIAAQPLTKFDDVLFEAMVGKVIIKSTTEYEFIFKVVKELRQIPTSVCRPIKAADNGVTNICSLWL